MHPPPGGGLFFLQNCMGKRVRCVLQFPTLDGGKYITSAFGELYGVLRITEAGIGFDARDWVVLGK